MKTISFYISDHGYGHASRSIATIRRVLKNMDVEVYVNCSYALSFVKKSLESFDERVKFRDVGNDFGLITSDNFSIQMEETEERLESWIGSWDEYIGREKKFSEERNVDLIISDVPPQPFEVADELGINSLLISNFTWHEIYEDLFSGRKFSDIEDAYRKADLGLLIPFSTGCDPVKNTKEIDLVTRKPTRTKKEIRNELGAKENETLVYFGLGKSYFGDNSIDVDKENFSLLVGSHNESVENPDYRIPKYVTESQNYIEAADLVVTKFGYSTISEAVYSRKPLLVASRGIIEDREGIRKLKNNYPQALRISREEMFSGDWTEKIGKLRKPKSDEMLQRYKNDGTEQAVRLIKEYIES